MADVPASFFVKRSTGGTSPHADALFGTKGEE
jgi:hypothetical protein